MTDTMFDLVVAELRKQLAVYHDNAVLAVDPQRQGIRLSLDGKEMFSVTRANLNTMGATPREVAEVYYRRYRGVLAARQ